MKFVLTFLIFAIAVLANAQIPKAVFDYDFKNGKQNLLLHGNAKIKNNSLVLDGKSYAKIPDSGNIHLTEKGLTIGAMVRFASVQNGENPKLFDMILAKGKEYIFGKNKKNMYLNFNNGVNWCAVTIGGNAPAAGEWAFVSATYKYFQDVAQGENGYILSVYVNGELEFQNKVFYHKPAQVKDDILIGSGFGGGPWLFKGEISRIMLYDSVLSSAQIENLFEKVSEGKIRPKGIYPVDVKIAEKLEKLQKNAKSETASWLFSCFHNALKCGMPETLIPAELAEYDLKNSVELIKLFNQKNKNFKLIDKKNYIALIFTGKGGKFSPLFGVFNKFNKQEILDSHGGTGWAIEFVSSAVESSDAEVAFESRYANDKLCIDYSGKNVNVQLELMFAPQRIESRFSAESNDMQNVVFPKFKIKKLQAPDDVMLYPYMCGIEVKNPTVNQMPYGQEGVYPSGAVTMQFGAYYDKQSGIYFAAEDPKGSTKNYTVRSKRNSLDVQWSTELAKAKKYASPNVGVIEPFNGKWYEAGQIYRKFLENKADWWIKDLPRKSTPEWFRNNTLWLLGITSNGDDNGKNSAERMIQEAVALKKYFGLPIGLHYYGWDERNKQPTWPHFYPRDYSVALAQKARQEGIYVKPYIDSRLWAIKDGPAFKSDYMYSSYGKKYAVISKASTIPIELYSSQFAVMCPAAQGWQKWLADLTSRVKEYGFDAVYHDQVSTGRPILCYSKAHGHAAADPYCWVEGYNKIYAELKNKYPLLCHDSEENAEVYLKAMDGFVVWRWTFANQVPLFQSIYSGRTQFTGRCFNHQKPGDKNSFFAKCAMQFVNGEQLGWFMPAELRAADNKRLFVKKLMHMRLALIDCFNTGKMLAPLKFHGQNPQVTSKFGGVTPSMLTYPAVLSSVWEYGNKRIIIMVNTLDSEVKVAPVIPECSKYFVCEEKISSHKNPEAELVFKPYEIKLIVPDNQIEAEKLHKKLAVINNFTDKGESLLLISNVPNIKKSVAADNKIYTASDVSGMIGCASRKSHGRYIIGALEAHALIVIGEIDFGKREQENLVLQIAVDPPYAGGNIEVIAQNADGKERVIGFLDLQKSTGYAHNYVDFNIKLTEKLSGKQQIALRFNGQSCCNFLAFKIPEK